MYILFNGAFYRADEPFITHNNRSFRYGDGLFETMRALKSKVLWFDAHYERLIKGMNVLGLKHEWQNTNGKTLLSDNISKLLQENGHQSIAKVRLMMFRNDGGAYSPLEDSASYMIETELIKNPFFELNAKGLRIDVCETVRKSPDILSPFKTNNALLYVVAARYKNEHQLDDCFILNTRGEIAEATNANIFVLRDDKLYTPPSNSGCIMGVMRQQVCSIAQKNGLKVIESVLMPADLLLADEIFLTNSGGIRWVQAYKHKRFYNKMSQRIINELNKILEAE